MSTRLATRIPLSVPVVDERAQRYVADAVASGWVSSVGPMVDRFEAEFSDRHRGQPAVAVQSGTAALHLALLVAGVEPGDDVIVPALTFIATANAVRYCGAHPVFADVDPRTWQIDLPAVGAHLAERTERRDDGRCYDRRTGRRVAALLPVHLLGNAADLDVATTLADEHGLALVEDAAESLGSSFGGCPVGTVGRFGCFSFNGNKTITTGGGGMVVATDPDDAARVRYLSTQAKDDPVEYVHGAVGFNYRLTNVQAALGVAQLETLDDRLARKRAITARYREGLGDLVRFPSPTPGADITWWLTTVLLPEGVDPRRTVAALGELGVETRRLWQPMHQSPAHQPLTLGAGLPATESIYGSALSLPSTPSLTAAELDRVIESVRSVVGGAA